MSTPHPPPPFPLRAGCGILAVWPDVSIENSYGSICERRTNPHKDPSPHLLPAPAILCLDTSLGAALGEQRAAAQNIRAPAKA